MSSIWSFGRTDELGEILCHLPVGDFHADVVPDGDEPISMPLVVAPDQDVVTIELAGAAPETILEIHTQGPDGEFVIAANTECSLAPVNRGGRGLLARTNAAGVVRFDAPKGAYFLSLSRADGAELEPQLVRVDSRETRLRQVYFREAE